MRRWWPPARRGAWPIPLTTTGRLTQDVGDRPLALFHQLHRPPEGVELHLLVIEPELPQDRRVQVAVVMAVFDGLVADAVCVKHVLRFSRDIDDLWRGQLHAGGQFVRLRAGRDIRVDGVTLAELAVQVRERLHLPFALGGAARLGWIEVWDRRRAR